MKYYSLAGAVAEDSATLPPQPRFYRQAYAMSPGSYDIYLALVRSHPFFWPRANPGVLAGGPLRICPQPRTWRSVYYLYRTMPIRACDSHDSSRPCDKIDSSELVT